MHEYIQHRGLFKTLYVDRAGIFGGPKRCNFSQMQRACDELGIEIIFANSAQGKGRIERAFDTLQDRLVPEFRLNNITDIHSANRYMQEKFIPEYWQKNISVNAKNATNRPNCSYACATKSFRFKNSTLYFLVSSHELAAHFLS